MKLREVIGYYTISRHISSIIVILFILAAVSHAKIFQDTQKNLHYISQNGYYRSTNFGDTWKKIPLNSTYESTGILQENSNGILYMFWQKDDALWVEESRNKGEIYSKPKQLFSDFEPDAFSIKIIKDVWHIVFKKGNDVYYISSQNNGKSFAPRQLLASSPNIIDWAFYGDEQLLSLYFIENKTIYKAESNNQGITFSNKKEVYASNNDIIELAKSFFAWLEKSPSGYRIFCFQPNTKIPWLAYESPEEISSIDSKTDSSWTLISFSQKLFSSNTKSLIKLSNNKKIINTTTNLKDVFYQGEMPIDCFTDKNDIILFANKNDEIKKAILHNPDAPQLTIISPSKNLWFKQGAAVFLSANVIDKNHDLKDTPQIFIDDQVMADFSLYPFTNNNVSGFILLPDQLKEGSHLLRMQAEDKMGNMGEEIISFGIDNKSPSIVKESIMATPTQIIIPIKETNSGIDSASTIIKISEGSSEVSGQTVCSGTTVSFTPLKPLSTDGKYIIEYLLYDKAGNSSSCESCSIVLSSTNANIYANSASSNLSITNLQNGPNPFNMAFQEETIIKYTLSSPANINLYIFSITGELLYKSTIASPLTSGTISWNGKNSNGKNVSPGIYSYIIIATDTQGGKAVKRGKIIVL